jgi:hypothetical protein
MAKTAKRTSSSSRGGRKRSTMQQESREARGNGMAGPASSRFGSVAREASKLTRSARERGRKIERTVTSAVEDNPLVVGAAMFVAGAAVGYAMRGMLRDGMWLEEQRDAVMGRAKEIARTAGDKVGSLTKHNRTGEPTEAH